MGKGCEKDKSSLQELIDSRGSLHLFIQIDDYSCHQSPYLISGRPDLNIETQGVNPFWSNVRVVFNKINTGKDFFKN